MPVVSSRKLGRYTLFDKIASGGMATVYLGRQRGLGGFSRTVAIKQLHPVFAHNREFVTMFLDEARLAARIRHPNVVGTLDVSAVDGELILVMEYVHGASLSTVLSRLSEVGQLMPIPIVVAVVSQALHGLYAAHTAKDESSRNLDIVHRDVSPQNVLIGVDGMARVADFGVAKASTRLASTYGGALKGKVSYMAPEQVLGEDVTALCDVYSTGVVLWEALAGARFSPNGTEGEAVERAITGRIPSLRARRAGLSEALVEVVERALAKKPSDRFATSRDMARALEACVSPALAADISEWLEPLIFEQLALRSEQLAAIDRFVMESRAPSDDSPSTLLRAIGKVPEPKSSGAPSEVPTVTNPGPFGAVGRPDTGERAEEDRATVPDGPKAEEIPAVEDTLMSRRGDVLTHASRATRNWLIGALLSATLVVGGAMLVVARMLAPASPSDARGAASASSLPALSSSPRTVGAPSASGNAESAGTASAAAPAPSAPPAPPRNAGEASAPKLDRRAPPPAPPNPPCEFCERKP